MKDKKNRAFNRQEQEESKAELNKNQTTIPIHSYWFFAIMVTIASSMFVKHGTVNLQWHDTYFVIPFHYIVVAISLVFLTFGFIYWSQRNHSLIKWMTSFHSLLTITLLGTFYMTCFQEPKWSIGSVILLGIVLFITAQVILGLNLFLSNRNK